MNYWIENNLVRDKRATNESINGSMIFNNNEPSDDESEKTTMTTEIIPTSPTPPEEQIEWKLISIIFITLTAFLFIITICLWRALPLNSNKNTNDRQHRN